MILCLRHRSLKDFYGAGNWKDVAALDSLWADLAITQQAVEFDSPPYSEVLERCDRNVTDVILHYSRYPDLVQAIQEASPWVRVHVRAHNPEALQHWQRYGVRLWPTLQNLKHAYGVGRVLMDDVKCRRRANSILGISDWDNGHYWMRLPGRARVVFLPYHSPWPSLRAHVQPLPWAQREAAIVCMPGAQDPIGRSLVAGFAQLAASLRRHAEFMSWQFSVTSGLMHRKNEPDLPTGLSLLQDVGEPWDELCRCRAVTVLTPLGFGMKTTIVDALAAGCHVLADPVLASRLPEDMRSSCLVCDPRDPLCVDRVAERIASPPLKQDVHSRLRARATEALRQVLVDIPTTGR